MKTWLTKSEWVNYSLCSGDSRFITPPERMHDDDVQEVIATCFKCPVRYDCVKEVVAEASSGVWCASVFIEEVEMEQSTRRARSVMASAEETRSWLEKSLPGELERRGEF